MSASNGNGNGTPPGLPSGEAQMANVQAATELAEQTAVLHSLLAATRAGVLNVAVADNIQSELTMQEFPVAGCKRVIARRYGNGSDSFAVPTTGIQVLTVNEARLGGTIVNSGGFAVILYLTSQTTSAQALPFKGKPAIWLAASGGSWDFRAGNATWCGAVFGVAQGTATTLTVAEF